MHSSRKSHSQYKRGRRSQKSQGEQKYEGKDLKNGQNKQTGMERREHSEQKHKRDESDWDLVCSIRLAREVLAAAFEQKKLTCNSLLRFHLGPTCFCNHFMFCTSGGHTSANLSIC